ncbi:MAG: hypothetical protein ABJL54_17445 [Halioglobus sp.]
MQLISHTNNQSLARIFALVALLFTGALQVQEAGHDHSYSIDGSYSQCLVCKTSEAMTPSQLSPVSLPAPEAAICVYSQLAFTPLAATPFLARGPPTYS